MQALDKGIFSSYSEIVAHTTVRRVALAVGLLLFGVLFFISAFKVHPESVYISLTMLVSGIVVFLMGIYHLLWKSKEYIYIPTGSILRSYTFYYALNNLHTLKRILEHGFLNEDLTLTPANSGKLKLDMLLSADKKFAAVQLSKYEKNKYAAISSIHYYKDHEANAISTVFLKKRE